MFLHLLPGLYMPTPLRLMSAFKCQEAHQCSHRCPWRPQHNGQQHLPGAVPGEAGEKRFFSLFSAAFQVMDSCRTITASSSPPGRSWHPPSVSKFALALPYYMARPAAFRANFSATHNRLLCTHACKHIQNNQTPIRTTTFRCRRCV